MSLQPFEPNDDALERRRGEMRWVSRFYAALEEDRFRLYAQTIQGLGANAESGLHYEVLIRMVDEQGELLSPGVFVGAARWTHEIHLRLGIQMHNQIDTLVSDRYLDPHRFAAVGHLMGVNCPLNFLACRLCSRSPTLSHQFWIDVQHCFATCPVYAETQQITADGIGCQWTRRWRASWCDS